MVVADMKKITYNMKCVTGVYSRELICMFLDGQVTGLGRNIRIYSDTINVINIKLCKMVLLIELYLFIPISVTLTIFFVHTQGR